MKDIRKISDKFPNDREFGTNVRPIVRNSEQYGDIEKTNPNDIDLGKKMRKFFGFCFWAKSEKLDKNKPINSIFFILISWELSA